MATIQSFIEFQYSNSVQQAKELEKIAAALQKISDREVGEAIQAVSQAWKGESANTYLAKTSNLQTDISKTAGKLINTASSINRIAKNLYDAEMKALTIIGERTY